MIIKLTKESQIGKGSIAASKKQIKADCATHWHEFYEIEYVLDGGGVCSINNKQFSMQKGSLFFMTPVDFHSVKTQDATVINIMFSADMATPSYLAPFAELDILKGMVIPPQTQVFVEAILQEIVNCQGNINLCCCLIDSLLLKLSESFKIVDSDNAYSLSQKMRFFIINNFKEKITLDDMAKAAGVTPTYASAVFKAEMQIGYKAFLNNLRFDYAKKLLCHSQFTVQQICIESGFDDYPNFIRRFKERFGVSPTEFRKKPLEKPTEQ